MDNFRVRRHPVSPLQSVDSFSVPRTAKQTAKPIKGSISDTLLPSQLPVEVVAAPQEELAPPPPEQNYSVAPLDSSSVATSEPLHPFDLASIQEIEKPKNRLVAGRAFRRWLLRGGLLILSVFIATGGLLFAQGYTKVHKVFKGGASHAAALQANVSPTLLKGEGDGRINILLLGNGGDGHDGPDLTDTMMIVSIDPVDKTASLLSIPRDLWVQVPNHGSMKINAAYEVGKWGYLGKMSASNANTQAVEAGFKQVDQVVENVTGLTIDYNTVANFSSFKQAVDTIGGVTVDVPTQLYDPTMAWENNNNPVLASPGTQVMNGKEALLYVRSRETTSDFARSQRQRSVILAIKQKVLTLGTLSNPLKISGLLSAFGDNMVTDFSLSDAVRAYGIMKDISNDNISSLDLVTPPNGLVTTANMNGISVDEPRAGLFNYTDIQNFVHTTLKDSYLVNEHAQVTVLNGSSKEGLATVKANELKSYGYNVTQVGNAPTRTYAKTVIVDFTKGTDKYTLNYLQNRYGVHAVNLAPDPTIQRNGADFIVILGNDQSQ